MLKHVGKIRSDVQNVLDAVFAQDIQVAGIFGTTQIQIGKNLDRKSWLVVWDWAPIRLRGTAGFPVRFSIRAIRAYPQASQTKDRGRRRVGRRRTVKIGFTML